MKMWAENLERLYIRNGYKYDGNACNEQCVLETQRNWKDYSKINIV